MEINSERNSKRELEEQLRMSKTKAAVEKLAMGQTISAVLGAAVGSKVAAHMLSGRDFRTGNIQSYHHVQENTHPCREELEHIMKLSSSNQRTDYRDVASAMNQLTRCVERNRGYYYGRDL